MPIHKVIKVGDSLAVVIPAEYCKGLKIKRGDFVILLAWANNNLMLDFSTPRKWGAETQKAYHEQNKTIKND